MRVAMLRVILVCVAAAVNCLGRAAASEGQAPVKGRVVTSDGKPARSAEVFICVDPLSQFNFDGERISESTPLDLRKRPNRPQYGQALFGLARSVVGATGTGQDGGFEFRPVKSPSLVVAFGADGYVVCNSSALVNPRSLGMAPWAQIRGRVKIGNKICGAGEALRLFTVLAGEPGLAKIMFTQTTDTDSNGHFHFDRVPGGDIRITREFPAGNGFAYEAYTGWYTTQAGKTTEIAFGGDGRAVVGRIDTQGKHSSSSFGQLCLDEEDPVRSVLKTIEPAMSDEAKTVALHDAMWSSMYLNREKAARRYDIALGADGSFRIEDVRPGTYSLNITTFDDPAGTEVPHQMIGVVNRRVTVSGGPSDPPIELGAMLLVPIKAPASRQSRAADKGKDARWPTLAIGRLQGQIRPARFLCNLVRCLPTADSRSQGVL